MNFLIRNTNALRNPTDSLGPNLLGAFYGKKYSMKTRIVYTKFWEDNFITNLSPAEKLIFIYLITNQRANIIHCYECSDKQIMFDTGVTEDQLKIAKEKFEKIGKIYFFRGYIFLKNSERYNKFSGEFNEKGKETELNFLSSEVRQWYYKILYIGKDSSLNTPLKGVSDTLQGYNNTNKNINKNTNNNINSNIKERKKLIKKERKFTEQDIKLTELLMDSVKKNFPFVKKHKITEDDYLEMNRIHRIDGRDYKMISFIIQFCQNDDFWKRNIRSVGKLRKQFDTLMVKAEGELSKNRVVKVE